VKHIAVSSLTAQRGAYTRLRARMKAIFCSVMWKISREIYRREDDRGGD